MLRGATNHTIGDGGTLLKRILYEQFPDVRQLTWSGINAAHQEECGNILGLVDAILTLPASSADAERGFSQLKMTKSSIRSVLKADRLTDLLTIQLRSPDIAALEPKQAIELWRAGGARRPDTHLGQGPTVRVALTAVTLTVTVVPPTLSDTD